MRADIVEQAIELFGPDQMKRILVVGQIADDRRINIDR
jgi:hypothetical protein